MMHFIIGKEGKDKTLAFRNVLKGRKFEEVDLNEISLGELAVRASTSPLLGEMSTFIIAGACNDAENKSILLSLTSEFVSSPHTFIFECDKLLKKESDAFQKRGAIVQILENPKNEEPFNVFLIANVFALRKKKELWVLLMKALRSNIAPENITGVLHWKVRNMITSKKGSYSLEELIVLSRSIVRIHHDSHRGAGSLELLLENFILTLD